MPTHGSALEVLGVFLRLGLTSFGGPIAHLGYFQRELVERRRWVDPATFADLVALCQFLPGPASSQVAMALGLERAGLRGALAAWAGFTLPSAVSLTLFAAGLAALGPAHERLRGLLVVAVPVVTLAVLGMARTLCPDRPRALIATGAALVVAGAGSALAQLGVLAAGGALGWSLYRRAPPPAPAVAPAPLSRRAGLLALAMFFGLLAGLPALAAALDHDAARLVERFYRAGALVFGGGHVVLPLLEREVVGPGWMTPAAFLAGYGAAQAVPGPLFSFAAYLGYAVRGWPGAALALAAIFLPSLLLVAGALPFWARLRASPGAQAALRGANAAVVGLLLAALVDPVARTGLRSWRDVGLAVAGVVALARGAPPWLVVALTAAAGAALPG